MLSNSKFWSKSKLGTSCHLHQDHEKDNAFIYRHQQDSFCHGCCNYCRSFAFFFLSCITVVLVFFFFLSGMQGDATKVEVSGDVDDEG